MVSKCQSEIFASRTKPACGRGWL